MIVGQGKKNVAANKNGCQSMLVHDGQWLQAMVKRWSTTMHGGESSSFLRLFQVLQLWIGWKYLSFINQEH